MSEPQRFWFVTMIETETDDSTPDVNTKDHRCWGFCTSFEEAEQAVLQNVTDIHEEWYQWAVIEEYGPGVPTLSAIGAERWYHWNELYSRYHEVKQPDWAKNIVNWAIG